MGASSTGMRLSSSRHQKRRRVHGLRRLRPNTAIEVQGKSVPVTATISFLNREWRIVASGSLSWEITVTPIGFGRV
jgi:hypothetical protein